MLTDIATSEDLENDNLKSSRREGRFAWYYMTTTLTSTSTSTSYSTTYTSMPLNLDLKYKLQPNYMYYNLLFNYPK